MKAPATIYINPTSNIWEPQIYNGVCCKIGRLFASEVRLEKAMEKYVSLDRIWHTPDDMPTEHRSCIFYEDNGAHYPFNGFCGGVTNIEAWRSIVKHSNLKRWAYVDDLLPSSEKISKTFPE